MAPARCRSAGRGVQEDGGARVCRPILAARLSEPGLALSAAESLLAEQISSHHCCQSTLLGSAGRAPMPAMPRVWWLAWNGLAMPHAWWLAWNRSTMTFSRNILLQESQTSDRKMHARRSHGFSARLLWSPQLGFVALLRCV